MSGSMASPTCRPDCGRPRRGRRWTGSKRPWVRREVIDAVDAYGRGIHIDPEAINSALAEIDPNNPESLQSALAGGVFEPQNTEAQNAALRRLETLLALIEGWVDTVVSAAA